MHCLLVFTVQKLVTSVGGRVACMLAAAALSFATATGGSTRCPPRPHISLTHLSVSTHHIYTRTHVHIHTYTHQHSTGPDAVSRPRQVV